jgi:hypothetical protein
MVNAAIIRPEPIIITHSLSSSLFSILDPFSVKFYFVLSMDLIIQELDAPASGFGRKWQIFFRVLYGCNSRWQRVLEACHSREQRPLRGGKVGLGCGR